MFLLETVEDSLNLNAGNPELAEEAREGKCSPLKAVKPSSHRETEPPFMLRHQVS